VGRAPSPDCLTRGGAKHPPRALRPVGTKTVQEAALAALVDAKLGSLPAEKPKPSDVIPLRSEG
jgi:hypothetical protein